MFIRLGGFAFDRRGWVLLAGLVSAGLCLIVAASVVDQLKQGGFDDPGSEPEQARALLEQELSRPDRPDLVVILDAGDAEIRGWPQLRAHIDVDSALRRSPLVAQLLSYEDKQDPRFISDDGTRSFMVASLQGSETEKRERFAEELAPLIATAVAESEVLTSRVGGEVAAGAELADAVEGDLRQAELISLPLTFGLLILVFGGTVAASLPVLAGGIGILGALAGLWFVAQWTDVSIFALSMVTMLGLGVAIDYSLFIVNRYREEMAVSGDDVRMAVARTVDTAGRAVVFSGLTTALSLAALFLFPETFFHSLALGGIVAVLVANLVAVLVIPALIAALGVRAVEGGRGSPLGRAFTGLARSFNSFERRAASASREGFWARVASASGRRPLLVTVVVFGALLLAGVPFLSSEWRVPDERLLPTSFESRQVADELSSDFARLDASSVQLVLQFPDRALGHYQAIAAYSDELRSLPETRSVESLDAIDRELAEQIEAGDFAEEVSEAELEEGRRLLSSLVHDRTTLVSVSLAMPPQSPESLDALDRLRSVPPPDAATLLIGGKTARLEHAIDTLQRNAPRAAIYILVVIFGALFLQFRSVVIPLKAILLNLVSVTASFGMLALVFQHGVFASAFGVDETGFITTVVPVLVFAIVFGISIDYEIFLLSRVREEHDRGYDTADAVLFGLQRSGRVITGAAAVVIVVVGAFATSDLVIMKQVGLGLAVAVLIDATLVRAVLVPSSMQLLGAANWWAPGWIRSSGRIRLSPEE